MERILVQFFRVQEGYNCWKHTQIPSRPEMQCGGEVLVTVFYDSIDFQLY